MAVDFDGKNFESLVGRTFRGKGGIRKITRVRQLGSHWDVHWCRPGKPERAMPQYSPYFLEWLRTAEEIV